MKKPSVTQHMVCGNNNSLCREMSVRMKQVELNARVVLFGKVETDKDGINHCEIKVPNFSMCHKLLQNSVVKLQQENY